MYTWPKVGESQVEMKRLVEVEWLCQTIAKVHEEYTCRLKSVPTEVEKKKMWK